MHHLSHAVISLRHVVWVYCGQSKLGPLELLIQQHKEHWLGSNNGMYSTLSHGSWRLCAMVSAAGVSQCYYGMRHCACRGTFLCHMSMQGCSHPLTWWTWLMLPLLVRGAVLRQRGSPLPRLSQARSMLMWQRWKMGLQSWGARLLLSTGSMWKWLSR